MNYLALLCLNPFGFGLKALIISGLHHSCRSTYITLYFNIYLNNNTMGILLKTCFLETIFVVEVFSNTKHTNLTSISPYLLLSFYFVTIKFQIFLMLRITFWIVICLVLQSSELNQIYFLIKKLHNIKFFPPHVEFGMIWPIERHHDYYISQFKIVWINKLFGYVPNQQILFVRK